MRDKTSQLKLNRKRWLIYITLFLFLLFMLVMTIVSRIINTRHTPIVLTKRAGSGVLKLDSIGKGVVKYGVMGDTEQITGLSNEATYYVQGYFYDKSHTNNMSTGAKIKLLISGMNEHIYGVLEKKIYDYKMDLMEVIISLNDEEYISLNDEDYISGSEVDFVLEENNVRFNCHIPKDIVYKREDGSCYIYILEERDSILGNVTVAVQMNIPVLAGNEERVAIKEEIDRNTRLIVKDDKLKDGIRVRERE